MNRFGHALFLCLATQLLVAQRHPRFLHLDHTIENHEYEPIPIVQDSLGFMWISNVNGVNKYNGYDMALISYSEIFGFDNVDDEIEQIVKDTANTIWIKSEKGFVSKSNPNGTFSLLSKNDIPLEDAKMSHIHPSDGKLWMVARNGDLISYDTSKEDFRLLSKLPSFLPYKDKISSMAMQKSGKLYMANLRGTIYEYDLTTGGIRILPLPATGQVIYYSHIVVDKNDRLWISTTSTELGLLIYGPDEGKFVQEDILTGEILKNTRGVFYSIHCDSSGNIWLGTDGNGLYRINNTFDELQIFRFDIYDSYSLSSNTVGDIYEDSYKNIWVVTNYGEINILPAYSDNNIVKTHPGAINNSPSKVLATIRSKDGTLWLGTDGKGMLRITDDGKREQQFLVNENYSEGLYIQTMTEMGDYIWISTATEGVWIFDKRTATATPFPIVDSSGAPSYLGFLTYKDSRDRMWIGTELGIFVYDQNQKLLTKFEHGENPLLVGCKDIVETSDGSIWLGSRSGLFRLMDRDGQLDAAEFERIVYFDETKEDPRNFRIKALATDGVSRIWIINYLGHLFSYDLRDKGYTSYVKDSIFGQLKFKSVEVENADNLWLGSDKGLWHLDLKKNKRTPFYESDGFLDSRFLSHSYVDTVGNLYFSSLSGINYFDPKILAKSRPKAKLYINEIDVLNKPALSIIPEQITRGVQNVDHLRLPNNASSFSFAFQAIEDVLNTDFHYSYRLKGFNDAWLVAKNSRTATYTNIPPGTYNFEVRAGTEEGVWNVGKKSIRIEISPPFYKQPWAYLVYGLSFLALVYGLIRWNRLNNRLVAEELEHRQDKALYDLKMNFFAKISHEIQTPLTLILIPIENMLQNAAKGGNKLLYKRLKMISNNTRRLSRIVFELTTVRNKELGKLKLRATENDLVEDLKQVVLSFKEQADLKNISIEAKYPKENLRVWYDKEKIEHILYNLMSNAIKFTPENGHVTLEVMEDVSKERAIISLKDSGPGIPKQSLEHVFELFYQADTGKKNLGMGIGLALVKELVDLHRGTIDIESGPGSGTRFTIGLATGDVFGEEEKLQPDSTEKTGMAIASRHGDIAETTVPIDFSKTLLIVEDNFELQNYLKSIFEQYYKVRIAGNGQEGLELAKEHLPNLILSDIMMPKLNGIDMTEALRKNKMTAHIPVVLLTAEKTQVNKIMALRVGAIEYLNKPFNVNELILKANNIMTRSDRLKSKLRSDLIGTPHHPEVKSKDDTFLEKLVELIEKRMENPEFKVEDLAGEMHLSYSIVYKKFQALTGKTVVDFVRSMRVRKAAMYLTESKFSVAESAYAVGFNDPKYFSKCFKNEFGQTPLEYKKNHGYG